VATKALTKAIKTVIARESETKFCADNILDNITFNSSVGAPAELYTCIPQMSVGTTNSQRIGTEVTPKSLRVKGTVALTSDDSTADIVAFMYIFTSKKFKHFPNVQSTFDVNSMLDNGRSGTENPRGTALNSLLPPNKEAIRVLSHKKWHLQKGYGLQNAGTGIDVSVGGGSPTLRTFDVKIKCPKLKYDDGFALAFPNNFAPVICFGYYHTDGTSPDILNQAIVVNASAQLYYDDA